MSDAPRRGRPPRYREPVFQAQEPEDEPRYTEPQPVELITPPENTAVAAPPTEEWALINEDTPRDGSDIIVGYGNPSTFEGVPFFADGETRLVRWKHGRYFSGRRWQVGGAWVPSDGMIPLPAVGPTYWLKPIAPPEEPEVETAEAEEAA